VSVLERIAFALDIITSEELGISTRPFRWRITANTRQSPIVSHDTYATKREAIRDGGIMLERVRQRGHLRP
jgi:hypothetical protein